MPKSEISDKIIKFSNLNATKSNRFRWQGDAISNSKIAEQLSLISVEKIDFRGKLTDASRTFSFFERIRSIRAAQAAQVIPSISRFIDLTWLDNCVTLFI